MFFKKEKRIAELEVQLNMSEFTSNHRVDTIVDLKKENEELREAIKKVHDMLGDVLGEPNLYLGGKGKVPDCIPPIIRDKDQKNVGRTVTFLDSNGFKRTIEKKSEQWGDIAYD